MKIPYKWLPVGWLTRAEYSLVTRVTPWGYQGYLKEHTSDQTTAYQKKELQQIQIEEYLISITAYLEHFLGQV